MTGSQNSMDDSSPDSGPDAGPAGQPQPTEKVAKSATVSDGTAFRLRPWWQRPFVHMHFSLVFLTRLPMPRLPNDCPALAQAAWTFPLVGLVVGAVAGAILVGAESLGLPSTISAVLGVAAAVLVTGALHEDGLADVADGFWGGVNRAHKLEIMHDSRIGTFGVVALILAFALRVGALTEMPTAQQAGIALLMAHVMGRTMIPLAMTIIRPARSDGLGATAGHPPVLNILLGLVLAVALGGYFLSFGVIEVVFAAIVATLVVTLVAHRAIGGFTGDVLGAVAVISEVTVLATLCALWGRV